jgi:hypothetical protein
VATYNTVGEGRNDDFFGALGREVGVAEVRSGQWFTTLVTLFLRARKRRPEAAPADRDALARKAIRSATVRSTLAGAAAGIASTGAAAFTFQTHGLGAIVAVPSAAATLLGEVLYRAVVHVDLSAQLAEIYGVGFEPEEPDELIRLFAIVFELEATPASGFGLSSPIERIIALGGNDVGLQIGAKLLRQGLRTGAVPIIGVATSTIGSLKATRGLGETIHRYVSTLRALRDAIFRNPSGDVAPELLIEGVWFALTANGRLGAEEAAALSSLVRALDPAASARLVPRFTEDEQSWLGRLAEVPPEGRQRVLDVLDVASGIEGAMLPERRMIRAARRALGLPA